MSATGRTGVRDSQDRYSTPAYTVASMIERVDFTKVGTFHEPCVGSGNIYNKVPGHVVKTYCELDMGIDYLITGDRAVDLIITNPPFKLATQFLEKSLREARTVCYLLRINFLGAQNRYPFWTKLGTPDKLLVLSRRPKFVNNSSDATEYAWFCWDRMGIIDAPKGITVLEP